MDWLERLAGGEMSLALQVSVAGALLMLGRRLYWLFVAGVGFVFTMWLATAYLPTADEWVTLALAVVAGILGALFAVFLQRIAVAIAGFAASAYFAAEIARRLAVDGQLELVIVLVGGVLGALCASLLFDWALILLTSTVGAVLLVDAFDLDEPLAVVVIVVLAIAGVSIQANTLHRDRQRD